MPHINIVQSLVLVTLIHVFFLKNSQNSVNSILKWLLLFTFFNELINFFFKTNNISIGLPTTIFVVIFNFLWLYVFYIVSKNSYVLILAYIFSVINLVMILSNNKIFEFNLLIFIIGAVIYLNVFIFISITNISRQNLEFFSSNNILLVIAPVLFYIGFGFMFAFKGKILTRLQILPNIKLFTIISTFVNIIYYTLINVYIYKERKLNA